MGMPPRETSGFSWIFRSRKFPEQTPAAGLEAVDPTVLIQVFSQISSLIKFPGFFDNVSEEQKPDEPNCDIDGHQQRGQIIPEPKTHNEPRTTYAYTCVHDLD